MEVSQPNRASFLERYDAESTRALGRSAMNALDNYLMSNQTNEEFVLGSLRTLNENRYLFLDDIVQFWIKKGLSYKTIKNYLIFIRAYLRRRGIQTHEEEIKDFVHFPQHVKEIRSPLTIDSVTKILSGSNQKYRTFFLCLLSGGFRPNELCESKISWFDYSSYPVCVTIPALSTKLKQERFTFISKQASDSLRTLIQNRFVDEETFSFSIGAAEEYLDWIRRKTGFDQRYETSRNFRLNYTSFRSFCRTRLSDNCGEEFAHFLLGQTGYLKSYYRKSKEEAAELYKKAEPSLTVNFKI